MNTINQKLKESFKAIGKQRNLKNPMQAFKLEKIVISAGVGRVKDKSRIELIQDRLAKITGYKPVPCAAKKSIASFKLRQGDIIGYKVTLRGKAMEDFLEKFINITLPRSRDFRGITPKGIDKAGNLTIGIQEHIIFPETSNEEAKDIFGLAVTLVTNTTNHEDTKAFLTYLGIPFKKDTA
ncbi:MAG: 50S ribosomal protein L5 [Candidatus Campbellbacteria bacterium]|nr:50S ribosomal protein L5 [Candidatus Campbellbacteria bacterium]